MSLHYTWSTPSAQPAAVQRDWFVVDAAGQTLGRLASRISQVLQGKHKTCYTPHVDTGDFVVVLNAEKIVLTGRKLDQKRYYNYSGYKGGLRGRTAREVLATRPEQVIEAAVKGMTPRNKLGRDMMSKLKIYAGAAHPHVAQSPKPFPDHV